MTTKTSASLDLSVGTRVLTGVGFTKKGEVRFIGETKFSAGEWVGIRLDQADGKNDGSVGDVRYFDCDANYGLFVKRAQVKIDNEAPTASASTREKLSLLREKRSSMLRDSGAASSGIPSTKPSSSTTSSTGSAGSTASAVAPTPRVTRSTVAATPAPAAPTTPPRAGAASTAAPVRSKLVPTRSFTQPQVLQTPAAAPAPSRAVDSFATPPPAAGAPPAAVPAPISVPAPTAKVTPTESGNASRASPAEEEGSDEVDDAEVGAAAEELDSTPRDEEEGPTPVSEAAPSPAPTGVDETPAEESAVSPSDVPVSSALKAPSVSLVADLPPVPEPAAAVQAVIVEPVCEPVPVAPVLSPAPVLAEAPAVAEARQPSPVNAPAVAETKVLPVEAPSAAVSVVEEASAPVAQPPVATPAPTPVPVSVPAPVPTPVSKATSEPPAKAPAPSTPAATAGAFVTPQKNPVLQRVPSSRTNPGGTPSAAGEAGPTPSKDNALVQFMQTTIYKLNQEKDELAERVVALNAEVDNLNAHLNQSNDLAISTQEEVDRAVQEQDSLRSQLKSAAAQAEQARVAAEREAATLRERIKKLENTPPPKDPRVGELEKQVQDLSAMVETLTLDKEALAVEQELLDEKYLQAQIELEEALAEVQTLTSLREAQTATAAAHAASGEEGGDAVTVATLKAESEKLREALRRLNSSSVQDKQTLATQGARLSALDQEVVALRAYKAQAEEDLQALRGTVDSVASYGDMIETLSGRNMELTEELAVAKEAVRDLEDTVELNEEIDLQQRRQIESDRSVIDMLNVAVAAHEQRVAEKDKALQEQAGAADRVKMANKTLKAEIQRLNALLSSGSQESKQLEAKLKELAYLRANQEVLASELHSVQQAQVRASAQKHKFQALHTRMDSIFGGTAVFIEESKQISTEIAFVSSATTGLEACRSLSAVLDVVLQAQCEGAEAEAFSWDRILADASSEPAGEVRIVPTLGKLHLLLVQAQAYAIQSNLNLFRASTGGKTSSTAAAVSPRTVQRMIDFKARFEVVAQLSGKLSTVCAALAQEWRVHASSALSTRAVLDAGSEGDADTSVLSVDGAAAAGGAFAPSEGNVEQLRQLLHEFGAVLGDFTEHMSPSLESADFLNILQNSTLLSSCGEVNPVLQLEMLCVALNSLCDVGIHQIECDAQVDVLSEGASSTLKALKSMKVDLKASVLNFKTSAAHYVENLSDIVGNFQLLASCFTDGPAGLALDVTAENTAGVVKMVQNFVRKLNSAPGLHAAVSSTQQLMLGVSGVTRFLPFSLLTNCVSRADTVLCGRLREQFDQHVERYWMLTTQTNSDLLLPVQTAASAGSATYTEVSWRHRVAEARNAVASRFGSTGAASEEAGETPTAAEAAAEGSPVKSAGSAASARLQSLLAELDLKKDELRMAMQRCDELQTQLDTAFSAPSVSSASTTAAAGEKTQRKAAAGKKAGKAAKDVPELLEEISTLEEALFATEQRVEALEQEGKALKSQLSQGAPAGGTTAEGVTKDSEGAAPGEISWNFKSGVAAKKRIPSGGNVVSAAQYQAVLDQSNHWKLLVLKRLTASLVPLPTPPALRHVESAPTESAAQPKSSWAEHKLSAKHVEILSSGLADLGVGAECASVYHKLRLARACGTRIKNISIEADSKPAASAKDRLRKTLLYKITC